jgi:capsule polysaccharide export protein KpsE/RkpR
MESYFNNISLVKIFVKWKWHFLTIAAIAALFGFIFSSPFFIKPKFKSDCLIYPSNIAPYSDESETEQMLQWLNSQDIKDSVIRKFDLAKHYSIDSSYKYFASTMINLYDKNVRISKTQYESIEIVVFDTDPVLARDMVNAILYFCNEKIRSIHRSKYQEVVIATQHMLDIKKAEMDSVKSQMRSLGSSYDLIDYNNQALEISKGYLRTVEGGSNINTKDVLRLKKNIEEKGGDLLLLKSRLEHIAGEYSVLTENYDKAIFNAKMDLTYINVISKPQIADKKSYPTRWLILLYVTAVTLFFSFVVISVLDNKQRKNIDNASGI